VFRPAAVAVAVGSLILAGCSLHHHVAASTTTTTVRATTTTLIPPGSPTPVDEVLPGQCFNQLPDPAQRAFAVLEIGCEVAHTYQVFDRLTYQGTDGKPASSKVPYPGEADVRAGAEQRCYDSFKPWMGIAWTKSTYDIATWWPTIASWSKSDRSITCAVFKINGKSTVGSVADAKK
jgi:hypothetical protein